MGQSKRSIARPHLPSWLWQPFARAPRKPIRRARAALAVETLETRVVPSGNPTPAAHDDVIDTDAGNAVRIEVLANDTDPAGLIDVHSVKVHTLPIHGQSVVDTRDGAIVYTPAQGFAGTDTFTYTFGDVDGALSNAAQVTVIVNRPTANDDFAQTNAGTPVTIDVAGNDSDPDGNDRLVLSSVTVRSSPAHGSVSVNPADGSITYTPTSSFFGTDSFTYTIADVANAVSNPARVSVTVFSVGHLNDDSIDTDAGNGVSINVLANDTDPSGLQPTTVFVSQPPTHGLTSVDLAGVITYTPVQGFSGTDTFTYTVKNGTGGTLGPATVTVVVNRPTANDDFSETLRGTPVRMDVLGNDTDPDGPNKLDPTSVVVTASPSHGNVAIDPGDGSITYTPESGFTGTDTFLYTVQDINHAVSNAAAVTITVDFGQIRGTVFLDSNASGTRTSSEPGLADRLVYLDEDGNGKLDPGEPTAATDANGLYVLAVPGPGTFTVRQDGSSLAQITTPVGGGASAAVSDANLVVAGPDFGNVPVSPLSPINVPANLFPGGSGNPNKEAVEGLYRVVLGRDADANGLADWLGQLSTPSGSLTGVAQGIWNSAEHRGMEVAQYFRAFLGRNVDAAGQAFWVNVFSQGGDESTVLTGILSSGEFQAAHASNDNFVTTLYSGLLGRQGDTTGQNGWVGALNSGAVSRTAVVLTFLHSSEALAQTVDSYYLAFFHRPADADAFWVNLLTHGATAQGVGIQFAASAEYLHDATVAAA